MLDIKKYIKNIIENTGISIDNIDVQKAPKEDMGDFAFPCFKVNIDGLNNPNEKAKYIKDKININCDIVSEMFVMGPYLNFKVNREFLATETLKTIKKENNTYGSSNIGLGQDLLIEHTSINPNASPHIGRSRNSIIGDFLVKLYNLKPRVVSQGVTLVVLMFHIYTYIDVSHLIYNILGFIVSRETYLVFNINIL